MQSILWLILRSVCDEVIDEEPTGKIGHGHLLIDFWIPSIKTIVEAKFVRSKSDFKEIENDIKIDSSDYLQNPDYTGIVVFVYDSANSVGEHELTKQGMRKIKGVLDVVIVSKPSVQQGTKSQKRAGKSSQRTKARH